MADTFYIPIIALRHQWTKEYQLGQGFELVRFPSPVADAYREHDHGLFRKRHGENLLREIQNSYCLKISWPIEPFKTAREMVYHLEDPAITLLIVLRIIKPTSAGLRTMFHVPATLELGMPFDFVDYRMQGFAMRRSDDVPAFTDEDVPNIVYYYAKLLELLKREYHHRRIFNALRFFDLGFRSENLDSRLIYFSIALEVLFKPLRGRISRGMTDRIVDFLGTNPAERDAITRTVLAFIDLKARITHGDMTYFDITRPENVTLVREQEDLLRAVLQKILQKDKLIQIFSQVRERDTYFDQRLGPPPPAVRRPAPGNAPA
ncbi:MAG: hypothetical protein ACOYXU_06300 [Nitrospirota bacterium]